LARRVQNAIKSAKYLHQKTKYNSKFYNKTEKNLYLHFLRAYKSSSSNNKRWFEKSQNVSAAHIFFDAGSRRLTSDHVSEQ